MDYPGAAKPQPKKAVHVHVHDHVYVHVDVDVDVDVDVNGLCHAQILSKRPRTYGLVVREPCPITGN